MFFKKSNTVAKEVPPETPVTAPAINDLTTKRLRLVPKLPEADQTSEMDTYIEVAKELGFSPDQLIEERLNRYFLEQNIPLYNYDNVDRYLMTLARRENEVWKWKPLREKDHLLGNWQITGRNDKGEEVDSGGHGSYHKTYHPYDKAVPLHILQRVKKIEDYFLDIDLKFFVSDYSAPKPDPFIMVTALINVPQKIFGVWDEPAFFAKKE